MVLVSEWRCLLAEPERGMDQEVVVVEVVIAEVIAAEGPVVVPISAEGTVKNDEFKLIYFCFLTFEIQSNVNIKYSYIYRSCLFKSKPIAFTGFFHLIYYPTTPSIQP